MNRFIGTLATIGLGLAFGCFSEPESLPDGTDDATDTESGAETSTSSTSASATTSTAASTTEVPLTTTSGEATTMSASTGVDPDTSTTGSTSGFAETTTGGIASACGVPRTTCVDADLYCEDFEEFNWSPLPPEWTPTPGGDGDIGPSNAEAYCGDTALQTTAGVAASHGVLGASIAGVDLALPHRFGGAIRLHPECLGGPDVRVMVLQYRSGGSQEHTVELWAGNGGVSVRQTNLPPVVDEAALPTGTWVEVSIAVTPGDSIQATVGSAIFSTDMVPASAIFDGLTAQLLIGPTQGGGPFKSACIESFDDLFLRGSQ